MVDLVGQDGATVAGDASIPGHVAHARLVLVNPGKQRSTLGTTATGVVKLGKAQAIGGKLVQNRRLDLTTITAEIRVAGIIGQDHNDIRLFPFPPDSREGQEEHDQGKKEDSHELNRLLDGDPQVREHAVDGAPRGFGVHRICIIMADAEILLRVFV